MNRDNLFWSAVGALAVGTAVLTAAGLGPTAAGSEPLSVAPPTTTSPRGARADAGATARSGRQAADRPARAARSASSTEQDEVARPTNAAVREALGELVRASRARPARAAPGKPPTFDAASRMPIAEMSFEQYRVWAKLGAMIAERDYRAVQDLQPDLAERFEPETVEAMLDATASDYRAYVASVTETSCEGLDPESVWRKVAFMSLWLGKIERRSEAQAAAEQEALRACGY